MYVLHKFTTLAKVYINTLKTSNKAIFKLSDINDSKNTSVMADLAKSTSSNNNNGVLNVKKHEMSPTYREMVKALNSKSVSNIGRMLDALAEDGKITRRIPAKPRSIKIL